MPSPQDLTSSVDIEFLFRAFYKEVMQDAQLAPFFEGMDMEAHLPRITAFWTGLLFNTGNYSGNPMEVHHQLHTRHPMAPADFRCWLDLFTRTTIKFYAGLKADEVVSRATAIAGLMCFKVTGEPLNV